MKLLARIFMVLIVGVAMVLIVGVAMVLWPITIIILLRLANADIETPRNYHE